MNDGSRLLQDGLAAMRHGDVAAGRALLARALRADPRNVEAWLLLAGTLDDDPARQRECYARVLEIDPDNRTARQALFPSSPPTAPPPASAPPVPPAGPAKRGPGLALGLLLLVVLACAACWGIASLRSSGGRPEATQEPVAVLAMETPTPEKALLPGLTQGDLKVYFEDRHFACSDLEEGQRYYTRTCTRQTGQATYRVEFSSRGFSDLDVVDASVVQYGDPDDALAADFLGAVAAFPYDGAEPDRASAWVKTWLAGGARSATFGSVPFALSGRPAARTLTIGRFE